MTASAILLAVLSVGATAATEDPNASVTSVVQLAALSDADYVRGCRFRIVGTVTYAAGSSFVVDDGSGRLDFACDWRPPQPGDRVRIAGSLFTDRLRRRARWVRDADIVGRGPVPSPAEATIAELRAGRFDYAEVTVRGSVLDAFRDEIDPDVWVLVLGDGDRSLPVVMGEAVRASANLADFVGAEICARGLSLPHLGGYRIFYGPGLSVKALADLKRIGSAKSTPFDVPTLDALHHVAPEHLASLGRRRVTGRVRATWRGDRFALSVSDTGLMIVQVAGGLAPPTCGMCVEVVGFPCTDLFSVNLTGARWRPARVVPQPDETPTDVTVRLLTADARGRRRLAPQFHGRLVRVQGIVRSLAVDGGGMLIEDAGVGVRLETVGVSGDFSTIRLGSRVEAVGLCLLQTDVWRPDGLFPHTRGIRIVPRAAADVKVLLEPPWWTPERMVLMALAFVAALGGVLVWNRVLSGIVLRRSQALLKEQITHVGAVLRTEERTRLAVELHDSLSQALAGVALRLTAARKAVEIAPECVRGQLAAADRLLQSCRSELRGCLMDLRSDALDELDFEVAVRKTVEGASGDAQVEVRFAGARAQFGDTVAHAVLRIVRELASNAVRHGRAGSLRVVGACADGKLAFSVADDGCGFDPAGAPGVSDGHFGLSGIRERVRTLGGTFRILSAVGQGCRAEVEIPL